MENGKKRANMRSTTSQLDPRISTHNQRVRDKEGLGHQKPSPVLVPKEKSCCNKVYPRGGKNPNTGMGGSKRADPTYWGQSPQRRSNSESESKK